MEHGPNGEGMDSDAFPFLSGARLFVRKFCYLGAVAKRIVSREKQLSVTRGMSALLEGPL